MDTGSAVDALVEELGFRRETAIAYVRARGRCEYCGCDLVMSRQGYAIAEIDHLLPQSAYGDLVIDARNFVLACRTCNGVKRNVDLLESGETAEQILTERRHELVERARKRISAQMAEYDRDWRRATEILHDTWWMSRSKDA